GEDSCGVAGHAGGAEPALRGFELRSGGIWGGNPGDLRGCGCGREYPGQTRGGSGSGARAANGIERRSEVDVTVDAEDPGGTASAVVAGIIDVLQVQPVKDPFPR